MEMEMEMEMEILDGVVRRDHVHILTSAPFNPAPGKIIRQVKEKTR